MRLRFQRQRPWRGDAAVIETALKAGIAWMPDGWRFRIARRLASRPARAKVSAAEAGALAAARPLRLGTPGRLPAWQWGQGPTVALVHGWGGRAAQMAPLAVHLANSGFRAVAFDLSGHGESTATEARWDYFVRDIAEVAGALDGLAGFVGHSAGGLALSAARGLEGVKAARYVCICAPHHPYPPIQAMARRLNPGEAVLQRYRDHLAAQLRTTWHDLESGSPWRGAGSELLLCYDEKDRYIQHTDGDRIQALCPGATLMKTQDHGHVRILAAEDVMAAIGRFLQSGKLNATPLRAVP
jgi:pimeloyl-ACP methyl ester carboxylesterase